MTHAYDIHLPSGQHPDVEQDEEWFEVVIDGDRRWLRIHDYEQIFSIPGLYEQLLDGELHCSSPRTMATVLATLVDSEGEAMADLTVLDVAAGNGMMGEELAARGVDSLIGIDIIAEAAEAAKRDRPGLYQDYLVADLTDLAPDARRRLEDRRFNCLTLIAALSFDEVPPPREVRSGVRGPATLSQSCYKVPPGVPSKRLEVDWSRGFRRPPARATLNAQRASPP